MLMNTIEFEQRLNDAFDNNLPIADKVNELRKALGDDKTFMELVNKHLDNASPVSDVELFFQQCQLHYKVAESCNYDDVSTTPIKNSQLWCDSVTWLTICFNHFIYLLQKGDKRFDKFANTEVLWWYKWVVASLPENPEIDKEVINYHLRVFDFNYSRFDLGERSLYKLLVMQGIKMGKHQFVETYLEKWLNSQENDYDDCWACQVDDIIRAYVFLGKYDEALQWSKEILNGSVTCGEVPEATNSLIAQAYFHTKKTQKAKELLESGYQLVQGQRQFIRPIAEFMRLAMLLDDKETAKMIYDDSKALFNESESLFEKMLFSIEASKLDIPEKPKLLTEARRLAQAFDKRNENAYYTSQLPMLYS